MTNVAILWHMHQPYYEDLATGEHILPWVRMHALKDYYGMVALLREFPRVKLTFNLVPSLLVQLEAYAEERARDHHLELGLKPAASLTDADRAQILAEFFHASRGRMIDAHPRYAELLHKRDTGGGYTVGDFLDLQVWHKLAWVDPFYLDEDPRVIKLLAKQRGFDEADKRMLREVELEILRRVIPEYAAAAARGQAELSASPFYHPILPLLCDTDIYLTTHPYASVPRPPFRRPEDAMEQLVRARECHARLFGQAPVGVWPSEGSVSDAAAALAAQAGFTWMATDEAILGRTLGHEFRRDGGGHVDAPDLLYRAYTVNTSSAEIACVFRDHALSDLIGFHYSGWDTEAAATDFVDRLADAGRRFSAASGGAEATIPVILDGENAWEHFHGGGRPFLRSLYGKLSQHAELRTVTMAEAVARPTRTLSGIFPGSWIDGNFFIWIGHADDQRAWRQVREARDTFDRVQHEAAPAERARAFDELLIAEGSDWCWWYGDDHSSEHDLDFDELFRRHLRNVYQMLGQPVPEELFVTNITTGAVPRTVVEPVGLLHPTLDGQTTSYFEWLPAGSVETQAPGGTMTASDRKGTLVQSLLYGFDLTRLYVRLDLSKPASAVLREGIRCTIHFTAPVDRRLILTGEGDRAVALLVQCINNGALEDFLKSSAKVVAGDILEASVGFSDLGLKAGDPFAFFVSIQSGTAELERHPAFRPVEGHVPDENFERLHWKA
jgi:alpha-amylase/alpha-mannosidase (GH57 family)